MAGGKHMKVLDQEITDLEAQMRELEIKIATLRQLKAKVSGNSEAGPASRKRPDVKGITLKLLEQVQGSGLNAAMVVDMAKEQFGADLQRGSVSALLSRLKGVVVHYDGKLYRLNEFAPRIKQEEGGEQPKIAAIHTLRNSTAMP